MNQDCTMWYNYTINTDNYGSNHYFEYPCSMYGNKSTLLKSNKQVFGLNLPN